MTDYLIKVAIIFVLGLLGVVTASIYTWWLEERFGYRSRGHIVGLIIALVLSGGVLASVLLH